MYKQCVKSQLHHMKLNDTLDHSSHAYITFMLVWQSSRQLLLNGTCSVVQQHITTCWSCVPWPLHGFPKEKRAITKTQRKMDIPLVLWGFFFKHEEMYFSDLEKTSETSCILLFTFSNHPRRMNCHNELLLGIFHVFSGTTDKIIGL